MDKERSTVTKIITLESKNPKTKKVAGAGLP